jgi:hypothetical protein
VVPRGGHTGDCKWSGAAGPSGGAGVDDGSVGADDSAVGNDCVVSAWSWIGDIRVTPCNGATRSCGCVRDAIPSADDSVDGRCSCAAKLACSTSTACVVQSRSCVEGERWANAMTRLTFVVIGDCRVLCCLPLRPQMCVGSLDTATRALWVEMGAFHPQRPRQLSALWSSGLPLQQ